MPDELTFREYEDSEAEALALWISGDHWPFHVSTHPSVAEVRKRIADGSFTGTANKTFWVRLEAVPEPIGLVVLHELGDVTPVFDLRLKQSARNRGHGRKIVRWLAEYVFTQTDKHRIEGHTRADNVAMRRVFRACGWVREAYYRQAWPDSQGGFRDSLAYAILKSDWESGVVTPIDQDSLRIDD
ncbi:MAG: GNAT family N-acetyltransferase [Candidatus Eisenbacteria bacterium]|nr:GNAT family N-acetyltransferase [Candidatus Latescibacterota bacterium]MBD3302017.1 GNAT family N-acetyltransferase [Candidatus Eisenbacteria bacterium]